ncbi:MAG TPA: phosphoadenylyl-sulfate reductase [Symbiobacteriaceae bacterium]|nr:phosphoadenylyl-sulfate reductase [Symbiobacteriaceae bacterium]
MSNGGFFSPEMVRSQAQNLADATPEEVLAWAIRTFPGRAGLTCSFSGQGVVLAHMIARIDRRVPVIFLDTGLHFPETYAFRDQFVAKYDLNLVEYRPATDPGALYETDPDGCCAIRKVEPMQRAISGLDAWITALRRDQSETRSDAGLLEYHEVEGRPLVKVLPLAHWSRKEVWRYISEHAIPYHPLLDQGYSSIGCQPCTRPTLPGEHERAGRWSGKGKTECGLHTFTRRV